MLRGCDVVRVVRAWREPWLWCCAGATWCASFGRGGNRGCGVARVRGGARRSGVAVGRGDSPTNRRR